MAKSVVLDFEDFTKLLNLSFGLVHLGVDFTFENKDLNIAVIKYSPLQKFQWL